MIHTFNTVDEAVEALAVEIVAKAGKAIADRGQFNLVLTGGSSPKKLYHLLATRYRSDINWQKVYFFIGDERYVLPDHKDYNMGMAHETLLDPLEISKGQIFEIDTTLSPQDAAVDYHKRTADHFTGREIAFDLVLLGMGADAHTASLFPDTTILNATTAAVEAVFVGKLDTWRISMTASMINSASEIAFLAFGADKADAFASVQDRSGDKRYPASLIHGNVVWYTDGEILKKG